MMNDPVAGVIREPVKFIIHDQAQGKKSSRMNTLISKGACGRGGWY